MWCCGASPALLWFSSFPSSPPSTTARSPGTTSSWCTTRSGRSGTRLPFAPFSSSFTLCSLCHWRCLWLYTQPWCRCPGLSVSGGWRCETWRKAFVAGPVGSWGWRTAPPTALWSCLTLTRFLGLCRARHPVNLPRRHQFEGGIADLLSCATVFKGLFHILSGYNHRL